MVGKNPIHILQLNYARLLFVSSKIKVQGTVTEVKVVEVELYPTELVKSAMPHMTVDDTVRSIKSHMERKFRDNDPSLSKDAIIDWHRKVWEKFEYTDYHKNDDVYRDIRKFNSEEMQYVLAIESIYHVLNN